MTKWTISSGTDVLTIDFSYEEAHVLQFGIEVLGFAGWHNLCAKVVEMHTQGIAMNERHKGETLTVYGRSEDGTIIYTELESNET